MAGIDWSSLISAGVGGLTALAGVLITQRSERKKAHADRIWKERAECYTRRIRGTNPGENICWQAGYAQLLKAHPDADPNFHLT